MYSFHGFSVSVCFGLCQAPYRYEQPTTICNPNAAPFLACMQECAFVQNLNKYINQSHPPPFANLQHRLHQTADSVFCGVTLEPYVQVKRGESVVLVGSDDVPEEGSPDGLYQLRSRWYRSSLPRGGAVCSIHPDREAGLQCVVCVRMRTAGQGQHLSYHCTAECLKSNWNLHRDYHKQAPTNGGETETYLPFAGNAGTVLL